LVRLWASSSIRNELHSLSAFGREGAVLAAMGREKFCDMVARNPALALDVLKILASETRAARIAMVESGVRHRIRERI
jgi:CRP-like cAMP-binding protein